MARSRQAMPDRPQRDVQSLAAPASGVIGASGPFGARLVVYSREAREGMRPKSWCEKCQRWVRCRFHEWYVFGDHNLGTAAEGWLGECGHYVDPPQGKLRKE